MFKIWSIFFLLPFVLFKKNYFFFILIPFQFFHLSYVYLFFWLLFVIFEIILIFFFYNFTHFRFFFLSVSIFDPLIFFRFVFHGVILTSGFESRAWKVHLVWLDFFFTINFFSILSFNTRFVGDEASLFFFIFPFYRVIPIYISYVGSHVWWVNSGWRIQNFFIQFIYYYCLFFYHIIKSTKFLESIQ
jgi:hypothetical protein